MKADNFLFLDGPDGEKRLLLLPWFDGSDREVEYNIRFPEPGVYKVFIGNLSEPVDEIVVKP
jgi:hypothetical protein